MAFSSDSSAAQFGGIFPGASGWTGLGQLSSPGGSGAGLAVQSTDPTDSWTTENVHSSGQIHEADETGEASLAKARVSASVLAPKLHPLQWDDTKSRTAWSCGSSLEIDLQPEPEVDAGLFHEAVATQFIDNAERTLLSVEKVE